MSTCSCGSDLTASPGYAHARCESCLSYWFPTPIEQSEDAIIPQSRKTSFSCPRCEIDLEVGLMGQFEVCFCSNCRGFVIDSETLGKLIAERRRSYGGPIDKPIAPHPNEIDVQGICPACFATLDAHHYGGPGNVVIDSCRYCKLAWFDHGELSKITRASGIRVR